MSTYQTVQNPFHVQDENGDIVGYQKDPGNKIVFTPRYATDPLTGKAVGSFPMPDGGTLTPAIGVNRTVALLGDSITYNNHNDGSIFNTSLNSQTGYWTFASQILGKRFYYDSTYNFGVFGDTTTGILLRLAPVIAKKPGLCVVLAGINDVSGGATFSTITGNLLKIWSQLNGAGIAVIAGCILPSAFAGITAAQQKLIMQVNQWMRATVPTLPNVHLWDSFFSLADLTSATAAPDANCFSADLLHPVRRGAFLMGVDLAAAINAVYPDIANAQQGAQFGTSGLSDVYDATYNPRGSLVANTSLAGVGGALSGTGMTGSFVANSWTVYRALGSTILCAVTKNTITMPNGQVYYEQQLVVSTPGGGVASEEVAFQQAVNVNAGDNVIFGAYVDVSAISGRVNYVAARSQAGAPSYAMLGQDGFYFGGGAQSMPSAFVGHLQTPALGSMLVPAGVTTDIAAIVIGLDCTVAGSVTVKIRLPYARKN